MTPADAAAMLLGGGNPVDAEAKIHCQLAAHPSGRRPESDWYVVLALALTKQKRFILAEETCRFALSLNRNNRDAQYLLSQILIARDVDRSREYSQYLQAWRPRYRQYPRQVAIETVGRCNASCSFCPNSTLERRHSAMSDDLFLKVVSDLREIPPDHSFVIFPNLVNDPLMDRKIFERCRNINEALPQAGLGFFTNLSFLPPGFFEEVTTLRNVIGWNVSFNAADTDEYQRAMGISFERTVTNIRALLGFLRENGLCKKPVVLSRVGDNSDGDALYAGACASLFPEFEEGKDFVAIAKPRTDWLGRVNTARDETPYGLPCGAWFDITIFCDGIVPHCCMDAHGDYAIGDVREQSVLEIYNSPGFRTLREHHSAREGVEPCNRCPLLQ